MLVQSLNMPLRKEMPSIPQLRLAQLPAVENGGETHEHKKTVYASKASFLRVLRH